VGQDEIPFDRKFFVTPVRGSISLNVMRLMMSVALKSAAVVLLCLNFYTVIRSSFEWKSSPIDWKPNNFSVIKTRTHPVSIHIFAWRRRKSLERLCASINRARYHGAQVPLYFHVDGEALESVLEYVLDFKWMHGRKLVQIRSKRLGMPAVLIHCHTSG